VEHSGIGERREDLTRQLASGIDIVSALRNHRGERTRRFKG
jgi:hypothetical protein